MTSNLLNCQQRDGFEITVIIVNWNSGAHLKKCLECLLNQTQRPSRVLVVDNASSDNSLMDIDWVSPLELIKLDRNYGFAVANNRAMGLTTTPYLALLNPDAFPNLNWLEEIRDKIIQDRGTSIVAWGCKQLDFNQPTLLDGIGDSYHFSGLAWRKGHGLLEKSFKGNQNAFSPCAACTVYRSDVVLNLEGFDEQFFCYLEDVDLGFRIRLAGYEIRIVESAVVLHIGSASTGGHGSPTSTYYGQRNLVWVFFKNMPLTLLVLFLPFHIAANLLLLVLAVRKGRFKVTWKAKRDALLGLPTILKKRPNFCFSEELTRSRRVLSKLSWLASKDA